MWWDSGPDFGSFEGAPSRAGRFLPISYVIASQGPHRVSKICSTISTDREESLFPCHEMANGLERTPRVQQAEIIAPQLCPFSWTSSLCPPVFLHLFSPADSLCLSSARNTEPGPGEHPVSALSTAWRAYCLAPSSPRGKADVNASVLLRAIVWTPFFLPACSWPGSK